MLEATSPMHGLATGRQGGTGARLRSPREDRHALAYRHASTKGRDLQAIIAIFTETYRGEWVPCGRAPG
jgi:hypothetical protein